MPLVWIIALVAGLVVGWTVTDRYVEQPRSERVSEEHTTSKPESGVPSRFQGHPLTPTTTVRPTGQSNKPAVIRASLVKSRFTSGEPMKLSVSGYDPDGRIVIWQLQCGTGGPFTNATARETLEQFYCTSQSVPAGSNTFRIFVRAWDDAGAMSETAVVIKCNASHTLCEAQ